MTEIVAKRESPRLAVELVNELLYKRELAVSRHRKAVAQRLGMSDTEIAAVTHLRYRGELTTSQLASLIGMSSAGTTGLVQRLTETAVIRRRRDPRDGRCMLNRLTSETARRLTLADAPLDDALGAAIAALSAEERAMVAGFLRRLTDITERHGAPSDEATDPPHQPVPSLWG